MTVQRFIERLIWWCVLPLLLAGAVLVGSQLVLLNQRREVVAESILRSVGRSIDNLLAVRLSNLQVLGGVLEDLFATTGTPDLQEAQKLAVHYQQIHGAHVMLANEQRQMLFNTRARDERTLPRVPVPVGQDALSTSLKAAQPAVGDKVFGPVAQEPVVGLAVPLSGMKPLDLVLLCPMATREIQERLNDFRLPSGWSVAVLDSTRSVLAQLGPSTPWERASLQPSSGVRVMPLESARWTVELIAQSPWPGSDLGREALLLLALLGGAAGTAIVGGRLASRRLKRAMAALEQDPLEGGAIPDITEVADSLARLKALRRERELAHAHLQAVFDSSTDAILCFDESGRIALANRAAARLRLGLPADANATPASDSGTDDKAQQIENWIAPHDRSRFRAWSDTLTILPTQDLRPLHQMRLNGCRADGSTFPAEVSLSRVVVEQAPLWAMVVHDITQRQAARREIRRLMRERMLTQERERRRIGLDLHDDLQQKLAVLRNELVMLKRRLPSGLGPAEKDSPKQMAADALSLVDESIISTRRLVEDLRPEVSDEEGLVSSLETLLARLRASAGLNIDLQVMGEPSQAALNPEVGTALYRITQEALNNVTKYAHADGVHLMLDLSLADEWILEISDDGIGFDLASDTRSGHGLKGMNERAQALGGAAQIHTEPDGGTAVTVRIPRHAAGVPGPTPEIPTLGK